MYYVSRIEIKEDIRKAIYIDDLKTVVNLSAVLGINKSKLFISSGVDASNYYKYIHTETGISVDKRNKIYEIVKELFGI